MVVLEAGACGIPILLRDIPDFRELFGDAHLAAADRDGFSACLRTLFSSRGLRETAGGQCLAMARRFDTPSLATELVSAYRSLCGPRGRREDRQVQGDSLSSAEGIRRIRNRFRTPPAPPIGTDWVG
jgi:1,2-diacylglycerol-3-alpha-glucose alpha-1,2-galactosyltransferase